jgi:addiction module RelE/StbE family toxin
MVQINWTTQSSEDLKAIADYISKDSINYARLQVDRIINRTSILKNQIRSGKILAEIGRENIRELIEGRYRIIYKIVSENQIDILTIHHSSRDLSKRDIAT